MNKEQEIIAEKIIKYLKNGKGKTSLDLIKENIGNDDFVNTHTILQNLEDLNLVKYEGVTLYRLTEKGWEFESFNKLKDDDSMDKRLAESNIKANELNIENAKYNKIATIINIGIGTINIGLLIWQLIRVG